MTKNCLMIRTKDRRSFFTTEENYDSLASFSKVFNCKIALVKVQEGEVLDFENLASAICDASYAPAAEPKYEVVESESPPADPKPHDRDTVLRNAAEIKSYITAAFLAREVVALRELAVRFADHRLSLSAICNHVARVRHELTAAGKKIVKVGAGNYAIRE